MNFRIADTFTGSLGKLTADEQKATKVTVFDLQANPANPGMKFHRVSGARDANFWSVRVNRDIRIIVHKTESNLLLCYVDHHEDAYDWAERRKIERHPKTGAAQLVEIRETVKEIAVPKYVDVEQPKPSLFAGVEDDDLLTYGVPEEWLEDVHAATEDSILDIADRLPTEASEAVLVLATGGTPAVPEPVTADDDPFEHPDAERRFRVMTDVEELGRALDYPWDRWTVFLHPAQRELAERDFDGPARVSGSAGTGKTIVALHRAVCLARRHPEARVLLTTFSEPLAAALRSRLRRLVNNEPRLGDRLEIESIGEVGHRLYQRNFDEPEFIARDRLVQLLENAAGDLENARFNSRFLLDEWTNVVDAWQIGSWEAYRDLKRLGRRTRLAESQRKQLWSAFDRVREQLASDGLLTPAGMFAKITEWVRQAKHPPYDFAVVDEAQDIKVAELKFLAALGGDRVNSLFFAGDLGQRIFQQPFSWKSLGVNIQGRSKTLHINYRTSHQIRGQADRLLPPELSDVDGNAETRKGTVSVFNGPPPDVRVFASEAEEAAAVGNWIAGLCEDGHRPDEIGVIVRTGDQQQRALDAVGRAGFGTTVLDRKFDVAVDTVGVCTMHLAKGLEFKAVVVMACDDEVVPLQERIEGVTDDSDLEEVYNTERHLLYVACTRARDRLLVTAVDPASEFLEDLSGQQRSGGNLC